MQMSVQQFVRVTAVLVVMSFGLISGSNVQATPVPALPGGATNLFSGQYTDGNPWATGTAGNPGSPNLTDNNLDTQANSMYEGSVVRQTRPLSILVA